MVHSPNEQEFKDESNQVAVLLARIDKLESRAVRFAWGPGDIEFLSILGET
jgi:hypothetical protein